MARWQAASCDLGFAGRLLWSWGAEKDNEVIPVETHDAVIAQAASPLVRPDPCDVGRLVPSGDQLRNRFPPNDPVAPVNRIFMTISLQRPASSVSPSPH